MTPRWGDADMASEIDRAYDHCRRVAKEHAKNFYYAFRTLPPAERRAIYSIYAFCRYCDDVADDDDLPLDEKRRLLAETRGRLRDSSRESEDPVFLALGSTTRTFGVPRRHLEEVIRGVETDLSVSRFQSFDQLRDYCYLVASAVGLICIEVVGYEDPVARKYAIDLGIAMQLTNVMRDVKEDMDRGRIYLPLDDISSFGYSEQDLMDGRRNESFRRLMAFQAERARGYFDSGARLFPLLSRESRACAAVLHQLYSRILDRMESSGYDVFERRIGLRTSEKLLLTAKLWIGSLMPSQTNRRGR